MHKSENIMAWSGIFVYLEYDQQGLCQVSKELIGVAMGLAEQKDQPLYAAAMGPDVDIVSKQLSKYPLGEVFLYETEGIFEASRWEEVITRCIQGIRPAIVLIGGTHEGRALAPRIAVACQTGLTADCTALELGEDGELVQIRPAFGGNVMARIVTPETRPQIATIRPGVMESAAKVVTDHESIIHKTTVIYQPDIIFIQHEKEAKLTENITKAEVLVVAGRGIKKKEDLSLLKELADLLGGQLASSRALVEKGWMSPHQQIGLSGNTVRPKCMITCGVSGTVQFMAGMKGTKNIIAINSDPEARIFDIAHYPICGDLYEIVPNLLQILRNDSQPLV